MAAPPAHMGYAFPGMKNLHNDIYPSISAASTPSLQQPGKVVLITGAGRGIGRAIAIQYAHATVASIILCARTSSELDEVASSIAKINSSVRVHKHTLSVTDNDAVAALAKDVQSKEGRLDILINNAGASAPWQPMAASDPTEWWSAMEVNVKGPFLFLHAFLPLLVETGEKFDTPLHVVNMSSIGAHGRIPGSSSYSISKIAVLRLAEFVDVEYRAKGVVAVGMHPGGVITELSKDVEALKGRKFATTPIIPYSQGLLIAAL